MEESPLEFIRRMKWRSAKPFHPFAFVLNSGRRIDVLKATWFAGSDRIIGVFHPHTGLEHLDPGDVKALRPLTEAETNAAQVFMQ